MEGRNTKSDSLSDEHPSTNNSQNRVYNFGLNQSPPAPHPSHVVEPGGARGSSHLAAAAQSARGETLLSYYTWSPNPGVNPALLKASPQAVPIQRTSNKTVSPVPPSHWTGVQSYYRASSPFSGPSSPCSRAWGHIPEGTGSVVGTTIHILKGMQLVIYNYYSFLVRKKYASFCS